MHSQPLTTIAVPSPGECGDGFVAAGKKINLDLRIGSCACASEGLKRVVGEKGESFFTEAQFHEFCSQILIYNSIAFGFPVAFHLLIPIWMSVFSSLGPAIYNTFPSFSGFSPEKSDHSSVMDPEPGRCKRTDGRKWRCSKNVVPLQKYCERHMHRGSRKHVEPTGRTSRRTSGDSRMSVMSLVASTDMDHRVSNSIRSDLGHSQPHSSYRAGFPSILKCRDSETRDALFETQNSIDAYSVGNGSNSGISVDYARSTCSANYLTNGGDHADAKSTFDDTNPMSISRRKQNVVGSKYAGFTSPIFGRSPRSVLVDAGKVRLVSGCKTIMEAEPQRCRRTDGKKWQCRRDTLPNQKYCEAHMHRGAKRLGVNPECSRSFQATPAYTSCAMTRNLDRGINLNTIPASPQRAASSSTSDATTISDENISFCLSSLHNE